jgi:hypothetical protein
MTLRILFVALAALLVTATAADAKRHRKPVVAPAPAGDIGPYSSRWDQPAHFVRLPNGLIVSSYECFTDEGYGRYLACGAGRR